jgi:transcriptional regulator with XRE-family HTH domain
MHLTSDEKKTVLTRIGTENRRRRKKLEISQILLATNEGVHPNVAGRLERGTYIPSVMTLCAIAATMNTSIAELSRKV